MTSEIIFDNTNNSLYIRYLQDDERFCLHAVDEINNHSVQSVIFDFRNSNISLTDGLLCMLTSAKINGKVEFLANTDIITWLDIKKYGTIIQNSEKYEI